MIKRLKRKFIILATVSMFALMTILVFVMNMVNYSTVVAEADSVLDALQSQGYNFDNKYGKNPQDNGGHPFDEELVIESETGNTEESQENSSEKSGHGSGGGKENSSEKGNQNGSQENSSEKNNQGSENNSENYNNQGKGTGEGKGEGKLPKGMSYEALYEARFFMVIVSSEGEILDSNFARIATVDIESVDSYVQEAISSSSEKGFYDEFRYEKISENGVTRIVFLDCGRKLNSFRKFLLISSLVGLIGCIIVFVLFIFISGRIIRPIAESYEKQKRFITDAGHEIKTPLTIISANVDLLEDDFGENDSLQDIRQQTKRLSDLTGELVYLSKMEESQNAIPKVEFPVSDFVSEVADSFKALAQVNKIEYVTKVQQGLTMYGAPDAIRQLTGILLENAMKYTPDGGKIEIELSAQRKSINLSVFNTTEGEVTKESLSNVFERFYRTDASRNSETGGHGIGLSIARAIVMAHSGTINATTQSGKDFFIKVSLPL